MTEQISDGHSTRIPNPKGQGARLRSDLLDAAGVVEMRDDVIGH